MTANAGYHAYATGDVLTAAQVQYNLQNQTVMYFATTTARDTALSGKLVDGMCAYTPATGVLVYVSATSTWTALGASLPSQTGNAGKYLTTDGSATSWGVVSAGSFTQIATGTLSGNTTTLASIPQTYKQIVLTLDNCYTIGSNGYVYLYLNSYGTSTFSYFYAGCQAAGSFTTANGANNIALQATNTSSANGSSVYVQFPNYTNTAIYQTGFSYGYDSQTSNATLQSIGYQGAKGAITQLQIGHVPSGAITGMGGNYTLYGVN